MQNRTDIAQLAIRKPLHEVTFVEVIRHITVGQIAAFIAVSQVVHRYDVALAATVQRLHQVAADKTRSPLGVKFLPIVTKATEKVGLADKYNQLAGKASEIGLMKKEDANIQQYVTGKALDGLFFMISEEEKKIRQNPVAYGSSILTKVFGALK